MRDATVSSAGLLGIAAEVLARKPRATLDDVARAAGLSRATVYRMYSSREVLVREAALEALAAVEAGLQSASGPQRNPTEALRALAAVLVPLGARYHFLVSEDWLESDEHVVPRLTRVEREIARSIQRARDAGEIDTRVPLEWQVRAFLALVYTGWEAVGSQVLVPRDAVRCVISSFLDGQKIARRRTRRSAGGVNRRA